MGEDAIIKVRGELTPAQVKAIQDVAGTDVLYRNPTSLHIEHEWNIVTEINVGFRYCGDGHYAFAWPATRTILTHLLEHYPGRVTYCGDYYFDDEELTPERLARIATLFKHKLP